VKKAATFLIAFLCAGAAWAASDSAFTRGVKLYEQGQYKNAAQEFEKFLDDERVSAAGLYNLGNCYFKLGQKGKAVWAYEKAVQINPRDEDTRLNLELLRKQLSDKQEASSAALGLQAWISKKIERARSDELAWAFSGGVGIFSLLILIAALASGARGFVRKTIVPVILVTAVLGVAAWARWQEIRYPAAVVTDREVYVRYGPSKEATRAFLLHEGSKVSVLKESAGWLSISFGKGEKGWLEREAVLRIR